MSLIQHLEPNAIFVFGSNAAGLHSAGGARYAYENFGAVWGEGHGLHGQTYAIDTMSGLETMALEVRVFLEFALEHSELLFLVSEVGCGSAGYTPAEIAPMFQASPPNVMLPERFKHHLGIEDT